MTFTCRRATASRPSLIAADAALLSVNDREMNTTHEYQRKANRRG